MKKLISGLALALVLVGCDAPNRVDGSIIREICIGGVVYYKVGTSRLAPAFKVDSTVYLCDGE